MRNLDDDKTRLILILLFSLVASVLMIIFTIPKASALEVKAPNYIVNNLYGYNVPQRSSTKGNTSKYYLNVGLSGPESALSSNQTTIKYGKAYFHPNNLPNDILSIDDSVNNYQLWTTSINTIVEQPLFYNNYNNVMSIQWGYHPGNSNDDFYSMFVNNDDFYYDGEYTYDFDFIAYSPKADLCTDLNGNNCYLELSNPFEYCFHSTLTDDMSCSTGAIYPFPSVTVVKRTSKYVHYRVRMNISSKWGMNEILGINSNYPNTSSVYFNNSKGFRINSVPNVINANNNLQNIDYHVEYYFSEPYNIVYWSDLSSITCMENCVSDDDAVIDDNFNDNSELSGVSEFFEGISKIIDRDYGFGGIINITYEYIERVLDSYLMSNCTTYNIEVLGQSIVLPCGSSFWNRNDMEDFKRVYEMIFTGIVSYWLCWVLYKYILNLLDPFVKPINTKEVDSL